MRESKLTGTDIARAHLLLQSGLFTSEQGVWQQEADTLNACLDAKEFSSKLEEKAQELYGNPFESLPESHQGRVRSEVAREDSIEDDMRPSWEKFSAKEWALALQGLTPGGSEFLTPAECVVFVHKRTAYPRMIIELREQKAALLAALENFLRAITSGNLSLGKNPYCIPEFKAAMVAVADAHGKDSTGSKWMDALGAVRVPE